MAHAANNESAEALLHEFLVDQLERERMAKAGVKKLHPEGFYKLCASGSLEEVENAIKGGVDPKIPDADRGQTTALHDAAASNPDPRVTALLVKEGLDVNAQGNLNKRTPLHLAIAVNPNAAAVIKELVMGKPDYSLKDIGGLNAFQAAVSGPVDPETRTYIIANEAVLLALLDANPDYAKDSDAYNPMVAYFNRFEGGVINRENLPPSAKVVERLLKGGCRVDVTAPGSGNIPEPLLFKAIKFDSTGNRGGNALTRLFLENGADVYAANKMGKQAANQAAFYGNSAALETLLAFDTQKNLAGGKNKFGSAPLHVLARWSVENMPTCGSILLKAGADINARDDNGSTPFLLIAEASGIPKTPFKHDEHYARGVTRRKEALAFLAANGADVAVVDKEGRNALHKLCGAQVLSKSDLEMFIKAGVNINARDNDGNTPMMRFIVASGKWVSGYSQSRDEECLTLFKSNLPVLQALRADPTVRNKAGKTAWDLLHPLYIEQAGDETAFLRVTVETKPTLFDVCTKGCDEKNIKDALAKGMDIDPVDPESGRTPLHRAIAVKDAPTAKALITCGAPLEKASNDGETPLGLALKTDQYDIAAALVQAGADVNKKGFKVTFSDNSPPFTTSYMSGAVFYDDAAMCDFLLQYKPDLEFRSQIWSGDAWDTNGTPLHVAIVTRNPAFAEKLIRHGANPSATLDRALTSALHLAARLNDKPMIELLLGHGAKIHTDTFDRAPYDYATDPEVKKILRVPE